MVYKELQLQESEHIKFHISANITLLKMSKNTVKEGKRKNVHSFPLFCSSLHSPFPAEKDLFPKYRCDQHSLTTYLWYDQLQYTSLYYEIYLVMWQQELEVLSSTTHELYCAPAGDQ